jgi:predicted transcriptional regulator
LHDEHEQISLETMANKTVTIELPEGIWSDIDFAAFGAKISPAELVANVMAAYLDAQDREALERAIREAESGEGIEHEEMERWLADVQARALKAA